jgi:hypothetical protein
MKPRSKDLLIAMVGAVIGFVFSFSVFYLVVRLLNNLD